MLIGSHIGSCGVLIAGANNHPQISKQLNQCIRVATSYMTVLTSFVGVSFPYHQLSSVFGSYNLIAIIWR